MYHIILNEHGRSKGAVKTFQKAKRILDQYKIEYSIFVPAYVGEATDIVKRILEVEEGIINLIVVGGDGTINEVINGITDFNRVRLGVIPAGSGNDFARGLGIKKNTAKAVYRILGSKMSDGNSIDIGKTTVFDPYGYPESVRFFGISSGAGLDAYVCKRVDSSSFKKVLNKIKLGGFSYIIFTIISLFTMDYEDVTVTCYDEDDDGKAKSGDDSSNVFSFNKMIFMASMNMKCEGGGVAMAPDASPRDGKLSLCIGHDISRFKAFFTLPFLSAGKHKNFKAFDLFNSKAVELKAAHPVVVHADGEGLGMTDHVRMEIVPGKLMIM